MAVEFGGFQQDQDSWVPFSKRTLALIKRRFLERFRFLEPLQVISEFSPSAQGKIGSQYVNER
nr:hypothetical protein SYMBAF_50567 [Serratia symbiotica]